jgi:hypothetical protein
MHASAAEDAAITSTSTRAVFLSLDLWGVLFPCLPLDRSSKRALRSVCKTMRRLVDGSIVAVATPDGGATAGELRRALACWPAVEDLTLLNVSSASDLAPLATASLDGLTSLTVRQVGAPCTCRLFTRRMHGRRGSRKQGFIN